MVLFLHVTCQKLYSLSQYKNINVKIDRFLVGGEILDKDYILSDATAFAFLHVAWRCSHYIGWHIFTSIGVLLDRFVTYCSREKNSKNFLMQLSIGYFVWQTGTTTLLQNIK